MEVYILVLRFFVFLSTVSPGFSSVLDPRGRLKGLGEKVRSACEEVENNESGLMFLTVMVPAPPG